MTHSMHVPTRDAKGRDFPSIRACARANGLHRKTPHWHLRVHGDLSRLGNGGKGNQNRAKETRLGNHTWPSLAACLHDLKISKNQFYRWSASDASPASKDKLLAAVMRWQARKPTDPVDIRVLELRKQGMGKDAIARELGVGRRRVSSILEATA